MSSLLKNYLKDLEERRNATKGDSAKQIDILRKGLSLGEMTELVSEQYNKIGGLKKDAEALQNELETERKQAEHKKKVAQLTN